MSFDLSGRTALVTGASRGIGYFLALELAKRGAHVIAVARTVGGLEELDDEIQAMGNTATLVPLDLKDMPALDLLGSSINDRWGKLDILVANAGVLGTISPVGHVEAKVFDNVISTNLTSIWRLIRSVDPLLRRSDAGRAILMSSGVAHTARAFWAPYAASKAAVEVMGRSWAEETKQMPLRVNSVNPGATRTAMRAKAMPGEDPETLPHPADVAAKIVQLADPALTITGQLYDVRQDKFLQYHMPS
ncbi:SDR family NAD(P)-dependent oxidoreductase [Pseudochrobactrum algeriensis]|uniref:SDR family NAD(P)-dependent oxidoreductase n=2 Tax=Hyphomicrobiales TaxID=356 RepID=UPI00095234CD|nr:MULTISPECIES: SDR family NAD(P)-dependent oxidoreductase [Brucellaceae]MBX8784860.1 SDR family NAD(P)-dependent oxidoreductase [Ochrobactrum sp. GRS2]MBX8813465.1 SDR family NAD(P)-dependent oxidoreductase [Ochrobactrum sp. MR34]MBX8824648.1 SDR family NAD(P)-dependent oxidoreductase [Ochrobactrum sp. SFR4]QVQ37684.1 SDR family NAD(P)-dependent oxidoreductase [Pseudochrobactrum algeriensis]QVQ40904.1 SDR family NAD(P)-dependent oxidoreductase [Pseudochrobactrum algeriensis]